MITFLTLLACVIPTLIYVGVIYRVDSYEKEPIWLLSAVFLWGAVPAIGLSIVAGTLLDGALEVIFGRTWQSLTAAVLAAPIIEETFKGVALAGILAWRRHEIDTLLDGIIYGAMVGMGFAMVENSFYFMGEYDSGGLSAWALNVFFRAFIFGLNHALFSGLFGLGVAAGLLAKRELVRIFAPVLGWTTAVFFHFIHNLSVGFDNALCLIAPLTDWGGILLTLVIITWALRQERTWLQVYLIEEMRLGIITFKQYELISDITKRRAHLWDLLVHGQFGRYIELRRFLNLCSKLAYQKHHSDVHEAHVHANAIVELRNDIELASSHL